MNDKTLEEIIQIQTIILSDKYTADKIEDIRDLIAQAKREVVEELEKHYQLRLDNAGSVASECGDNGAVDECNYCMQVLTELTELKSTLEEKK